MPSMPWWTREEEVASLPPQVDISFDMVISEADGVPDLTLEQVIALCGGVSRRQFQRASMQRPSSTHRGPLPTIIGRPVRPRDLVALWLEVEAPI